MTWISGIFRDEPPKGSQIANTAPLAPSTVDRTHLPSHSAMLTSICLANRVTSTQCRRTPSWRPVAGSVGNATQWRAVPGGSVQVSDPGGTIAAIPNNLADLYGARNARICILFCILGVSNIRQINQERGPAP